MSTLNLKKKKGSNTGKAFLFIYLTTHVRPVIRYASKYVDKARFMRGRRQNESLEDYRESSLSLNMKTSTTCVFHCLRCKSNNTQPY